MMTSEAPSATIPKPVPTRSDLILLALHGGEIDLLFPSERRIDNESAQSEKHHTPREKEIDWAAIRVATQVILVSRRNNYSQQDNENTEKEILPFHFREIISFTLGGLVLLTLG